MASNTSKASKTAKSRCARCNAVFYGVDAFDAHFVGGYEERTESVVVQENNRRCMNGYEMTSAGLVLNANGIWAFTDMSEWLEQLAAARAVRK